MSACFIGEIKLFAGNFNPRGWMFCNGALLSISQYTALFSLLGTNYGGNGQTTFGLPDLRGRVPVHHGQGPGLPLVNLGEMAGTPTVTLISSQIPQHSHAPVATTGTGNVVAPGPTVIPAKPVDALAKPMLYVEPGTSSITPTAMANTVGVVGGSQSHDNMMPSLGLNYIIAVEGIFPSRN